MCVAYPGKILSIENQHACVDFTGSVVPVNISMVDVEIGDYVLVHAGMAIQKVETEEAQEWIALFRDLEEATADIADEAPAVVSAEKIETTVQDESTKFEPAESETEDTHHA
ncbi:MAG: HypC/HybG/HupF family hydrogenase formation chaperone [Acidaminococcaceae bacterium]|nr:HypC/HybG/HupF family hydrogenase formation chaperone [Acidaminococcaceae bacterium]